MRRRPIRHFLPGPVWVAPEVLAAQGRQPIGHRSAPFRRILGEIGAGLRAVYRTARPVVVATGSATLLMEAAVSSTVETRVLNLVCGAFSERWRRICSMRGLAADLVAVPAGRPVPPDLVRAALRRGRYDAVTVVHSETSTGVLNPIAEISEVVREESNALLLVDAVSSMAGAPVETDAWGLDVVLTASQKALAVPPGLSFASVSERAAARIERLGPRGFYTDLGRYLGKDAEGGTITTPAVTLCYALARQLERIAEEGIEERWRRHEAMRRRLVAWAEDRGVGLFGEVGAGSPTVTALEAPEGVDARRLVSRLAERGWTIAGGYGELAGTTYRIGHMGEVGPEDLEALLEVLGAVLDGEEPSGVPGV